MKRGLKKFLSRVAKGYKEHGEGFWLGEVAEANNKKRKPVHKPSSNNL